MQRTIITLLLFFLIVNINPACAMQLEDMQEDTDTLKNLEKDNNWYKIGRIANCLTTLNHIKNTNNPENISEGGYQLEDAKWVQNKVWEKNGIKLTISNGDPEINSIVQLKSDNSYEKSYEAFTLRYWTLKAITINTNKKVYTLFNGASYIYLSESDFKKYYTGLSFNSDANKEQIIETIYNLQIEHVNDSINDVIKDIQDWTSCMCFPLTCMNKIGNFFSDHGIEILVVLGIIAAVIGILIILGSCIPALGAFLVTIKDAIIGLLVNYGPSILKNLAKIICLTALLGLILCGISCLFIKHYESCLEELNNIKEDLKQNKLERIVYETD